MLPSTRVILENPLLDRVSLNCEPRSLVATADKLTVYLPLTVASLEPEGTSNARRIVGVRKAIEVGGSRGNSCGVYAVVRYNRTVNDDLQYLVSLTSAQNFSRGTASIFLLQPVLEEESLAGVKGEINDYIDAFGYRESRAVYLNRSFQQIAICRDLPEWFSAVVWTQHE